MKKIRNVIIILFIFLTSCDSKNENGILKHICINDFSTEFLHGIVLNFDSVWKPTNIYCKDTVIMTIDFKYSEQIVTCYNINNGSIVSKNISLGNGPDENLSCWTLQFLGEDIYALDPMLKVIQKYKYLDFISKSNIKPLSKYSFKSTPIYSVKTTANQFISNIISDKETLLTKFDSLGNKIDTIINYPEIQNETILNDDYKKQVFSNKIYYKGLNERLVVSYDFFDLIDIYDKNINLIKRILEPYQLNAELINSGNIFYPNENTLYTFEKCSLTNDKIYVLYCGLTDDEYSDDTKNPYQIFTFDYEGNPLNYYQLDIPIFTFCVDENSNAIYGLADNPERCIVKFQL